MGLNVNKQIVAGHIGQEPRFIETSNGSFMCAFTVATDESYKDKQTNEKVKDTEWHSVVCFGKIAKWVSENVVKGDNVFCEGRAKTRKFTDKNNQDREVKELNAWSVQKLNRSEKKTGIKGNEDANGNVASEELPF